MIEARVKHLQIQPLKGGGSLSLEQVRMTQAGMETADGKIKDHGLVVVTAGVDDLGYHNFFTQRVQVDPKKNLFVPGTPQLAMIKPEVHGGHLVLSFDGDRVIDPGERNDDPRDELLVQVWEYRGKAIEVPHLSRWVSKRLGKEVKVARTSGPWNRMSRQNFMVNDNPLRAQDGYPVHAVADSDSNAAFQAIDAPNDPKRFRYQVLLEGVPRSLIHEYQQIDINGVTVDQPKPCGRCEVTGIDQETGEFSPIKPLAGLNRISRKWVRRDPGNEGKKEIVMGENWLPKGETVLKVGDSVTLSRKREESLEWESTKSGQLPPYRPKTRVDQNYKL